MRTNLVMIVASLIASWLLIDLHGQDVVTPRKLDEAVSVQRTAIDAELSERERLLQACVDRRFRIAPLPVDLIHPKPLLERCSLPLHEAFQGVRMIDVVALPERYCWGVLLVSPRKDFTKVRFGSLIPVVTIGASYRDDNDLVWPVLEPKA